MLSAGGGEAVDLTREGNVRMQGLSPAVPCLFPGCDETVRFDLSAANGDGRTPRAHARCPNGHPHYAEDHVRYGTDRETGRVRD